MAGHHADVTDVSVGRWITTRRCAKTPVQATLADVTDGWLRTPDRSTPRISGTWLSGSAAARMSRSSAGRLTAQASLRVSRAPARPPRAGATASSTAPQLAGPPPVAGSQARHLLGECRPGAPPIAAEEPADPQVNAHLLTAASGIGQLPPVPAVHPPRHRAALRAGRLAATGPGRHVHRPACHGYALDDHAGQVRDQNGESLKIARPP